MHRILEQEHLWQLSRHINAGFVEKQLTHQINLVRLICCHAHKVKVLMTGLNASRQNAKYSCGAVR